MEIETGPSNKSLNICRWGKRPSVSGYARADSQTRTACPHGPGGVFPSRILTTWKKRPRRLVRGPANG